MAVRHKLRPVSEPLESRRLLTSVVVNTTIDSLTPGSGLISLRNAVATANASSTPTNITFNATTFATLKTITLASPLTLTNAAQATLVTGPSAGLTLSGNNSTNEAFIVNANVKATLSKINIIKTFTHGVFTYAGSSLTMAGGSVSSNLAYGILAQGNVTLDGVAISSNLSTGLFIGQTGKVTNSTIAGNTGNTGGGFFNNGTTTLTNVTVSGNSAVYGAGIYNAKTLTMTNCTVANNVASNTAGGISNGSVLTLTNVTIAGNKASSTGAGGLSNAAAGTVNIANTIVAGNTASTAANADVSGKLTSGGNNFIGVKSGATGLLASDLGGTTASPLSAKLNALASNGGTTQNMLPQAGSPVLDKGANAKVPAGVTTDQRGQTRISHSVVDIGAVEVQVASLPVISIVATDATATEPSTTSTPASDTGKYTISRTGATTAALTVNVAISGTATNGTDYNALAATVTIPAGSASATVTLTPKADALAESTEAAIVTLGAASTYTVDSTRKSATINIVNTVPPFAILTSGVLTITGTSAADKIGLSLSGTTLSARLNALTPLTFSSSAVTSVRILGSTGNDIITVGAGVRGSYIDAGDGNDSVYGGSNADSILGGLGNDLLVGGLGADSLNGGDGDDTLIALDGVKETVIGGAGADSAQYDSTDVVSLVEDILA